MSRYLNHLAALTLNQVEPVQPRLTSRFEASGEGEKIGSLGNTGENQDMSVGEALVNARTPDIVETQAPIDELIKSVMPTFLQVESQLDGGQKQANRAKPATSVKASINQAPKVPDAQPERAWPPMGLFKPINTQSKPITQSAKAVKQPFQPRRAEQTLNTIERSQEQLFTTTHSEFVSKETAHGDNFQDIKRWEDIPRPVPVKPTRITVRSEQSAATPVPAQSTQAASAPAEQVEAPEPTIQVTIGRIEIRATQTPDKPTAKPRAASTTMSLDDYLKQRNGSKS